MLKRYFLLLVAVLALAGCARTRPQAVLAGQPERFDPQVLQARSLELARQVMDQRLKNPAQLDYLIGSKDVLEISVYELPKYTITARVASDGTIRFPELGVLKVSGLSERQLEERLCHELQSRGLVTQPQVNVLVKELHAREVTVAGEVKNPGVYPLQGGEGLIDLISKAGGLSPTAGGVAYVLRGGVAAADAGATSVSAERTIKIDLAGLLLRGEQQWNLPLLPGDRLTVPTLGWVHVTGPGITKSGTYQLRTTPTLLRQVIDEAEGLKFSADHTLQIVRRNPTGREETFLVNYDRILADDRNDIIVQGGDTVIVNRTPVKATLAAIGTGIEKVVRVSFNVIGGSTIY